jgi:protein O-GlcNAc transferase
MNRKERRIASKRGAPAPDPHQALFSEALRLHQAGRLADAERLYRQILAADGRHSGSLHLLGVLALTAGRPDTAVELIRQAIGLRGDVAPYHSNLGNALRTQGKLEEAVASYRRALALKPDYGEAHYNLATALQALGRIDDAIGSYRRALQFKLTVPEVHNDLAAALRAAGRFDDAKAAYELAIKTNPEFAAAHNGLGDLLRQLGDIDGAVSHCQRAVELAGATAEFHNNLGIAFRARGDQAAAVRSFERALALKPDLPESHNNLGNALKDLGRLGDAVAHYERAVALKPDYARAHNNLGNALKDRGQPELAVAEFERALSIAPDLVEAHSNLLLCLNYLADLPDDRIYAESRRWWDRHGAPHLTAQRRYDNERDPERRLRIGYVSPDFRRHSVSHFLEPLLAAHDRAAVEVFAYAELRSPDAVTGRLRALTDHWRPTIGLTDDVVAAQVRQDGIDILVDLAGHTSGNRLPVFARAPAPVQVTWLGYPNTTGLDTIGYRLVDAITDPDGAETWTTERLIRLDGCFLCYAPPADAPAPVPPPGSRNAAVTFGSFNNVAKLTAATLQCWAELLGRVPGSRLLLKGYAFDDAEARSRLLRDFERRAIAAERVELQGPISNPVEHLRAYERIDIALDPFPYNGTTTTCEALWMGVPVVALRGSRHAARVGASLLHHVGLESLVARDVAQYIEVAAALAADRTRLQELRGSLRSTMAASRLCAASSFARGIEAAYRQMWRRWCEGQA